MILALDITEAGLPGADGSQPSPGNGNIGASSDPGGALLVRSDYSPFGQVVARYRLGPPGDTRPDRLSFGFSTKYTDAESGLLYHGYRYLDPVAGRWLSRDPIGEKGGVNLYGFVFNNSMQWHDHPGGVPGKHDPFGNKTKPNGNLAKGQEMTGELKLQLKTKPL